MPSREPSIKATRILGNSLTPPPAVSEPAESIADPEAPRRIIEYGLQRRGLLANLRRHMLMRNDLVEADPYLLRAAKYHGEEVSRPCPLCPAKELREVIFTFGGDLGWYSGRVHARSELPQMAHEFGAFRVYVVEVCTHCGWNHPVVSYVLGDGVPRKPPGKPRDVLD